MKLRVLRKSLNVAALRPLAVRCRVCEGEKFIAIATDDGETRLVRCPWCSGYNPNAATAKVPPATLDVLKAA
jgi:hypothetical protein